MVGRRLHRRLSRTSVVKTAGRDEGADVPFDLAVPFVPPANALTFDVVIHCAGSFGGDGLDDAVNNEIVNAVGSLRVAQLAQAVRCRHVISVNSLSICDHPENQYFGSYGLSKKHGHENLAWGCRTLGLEYTALLASQLYDAVRRSETPSAVSVSHRRSRARGDGGTAVRPCKSTAKLPLHRGSRRRRRRSDREVGVRNVSGIVRRVADAGRSGGNRFSCLRHDGSNPPADRQARHAHHLSPGRSQHLRPRRLEPDH